MAGYRRQAKVYKLRFEDEGLAGLEVKAKSVPLGTFLDLTGLAEVQNGPGGSEQFDQIRNLLSFFAEALLSWNLEDDTGQPVPATLDGIKSQEFDFILQIITAWLDAISGVAAPLVTPSPDGATILEASLPMAPLSPSLESSTTPS